MGKCNVSSKIQHTENEREILIIRDKKVINETLYTTKVIKVIKQWGIFSKEEFDKVEVTEWDDGILLADESQYELIEIASGNKLIKVLYEDI